MSETGETKEVKDVQDAKDASADTSGRKKRGQWMQIVFLILVAVFLARHLYKNWESYKNLDVQIHWHIFALALLLHYLYKGTQALLWHYITWLDGCSIHWLKACYAYIYSTLGKYIPGKVFMLLARIPPYEEAGAPIRKVTVCFFLENMCTVLATALIFVVSLLYFPNDILAQYSWMILILLVVFVICLHPRIINFFLRIVEKVIKKDLRVNITYVQMLLVVGLFCLNWLILGAGFCALIYSIFPIPYSHLLYVIGIFGLSVMMGILAIFAPSGIGVREGIIILGLSMVMPQEYAVLISVISRIWMTVAELSEVAIVWIIRMITVAVRRRKRKQIDRKEEAMGL